MRRNARKAKQSPSRSASSAETKITQLTRERDEALAQQSATTDVLKVVVSQVWSWHPFWTN
jgi:hypothetical protein